MVEKAVILARGAGTRMQATDPAAPLTADQRRWAESGVKAMIPVGPTGSEADDTAARPFLDFVLSGLADAGISQVCLVVAPEATAIRRRYLHDVRLTRLSMAFAEQAEPAGTANAVLAARAFAGDDPFLVLNADNYYPVGAFAALREVAEPALPGFQREALVQSGNIPPDRIRSYAVLRVGDDGYLEDIVEKPDAEAFARFGDDALVSMNLWSFAPDIFDACERVPPSARGEMELPEAVRLAVRHLGARLRVIPVSAGVLDLSRQSDVAAVTAALANVRVSL